MIAKNTSASLIMVHAGASLTYVVNILKAEPLLGLLTKKHYEVHGEIGGNVFKVSSSLSLRHAYFAFKNLQSLCDFPEWGSATGIVEVTNVEIQKSYLVIECNAIVLEEDYLI